MIDPLDLRKKILFLQSGHYLLYCFLTVLIYYLINSLIVFINLILGHHFRAIDSWVEQSNFYLVSVSKIIAFYVDIKLINIYGVDKKSFKDCLGNLLFRPTISSLVVILFLWIVLTSFFRPIFVWDSDTIIELSMIWNSIWGSLIFYLLDILLIITSKYVIESDGKDREYAKNWDIIVYLISFWVTTLALVPYKSDLHPTIFLNYLILLSLFWWNPKNIGDPLFFIFFIVVPINALFGMNIFWDKDFTPFQFQDVSMGKMIFVWGVAFLYVLLRSGKIFLNLRNRKSS